MLTPYVCQRSISLLPNIPREDLLDLHRQRNPKELLYLFLEEQISFFGALSILIYAPWSTALQEMSLLHEESIFLLNMAVFRAHQIPYEKKDGSALNKHIDLSSHQALDFCLREPPYVP